MKGNVLSAEGEVAHGPADPLGALPVPRAGKRPVHALAIGRCSARASVAPSVAAALEALPSTCAGQRPLPGKALAGSLALRLAQGLTDMVETLPRTPSGEGTGAVFIDLAHAWGMTGAATAPGRSAQENAYNCKESVRPGSM